MEKGKESILIVQVQRGRRQGGGRLLKVTIKQADVRNEEEGGVRDASEISAGVGAAFTGEKTRVGMGSQRPCWEFEGARCPTVGQAGWKLVAQIFIWDLLTCT